MPPREAKGRYLTREYMADAAFHRDHGAEVRELYMLLALFSDDDGWLEWDPEYLMFAIYRYDDRRVELFADGTARLVQTRRLKVYKCGHAHMPKVANRPRPGEHEYRVRDAHMSRCQSKNGRPQSTPSRPGDDSLPRPKPNLNLTDTSPNSNVEGNQPRGRARGGDPRSLKEIVGWKPGDN
jgi:hypothetical protein